jgi:hypothetical protein
MKNINKSIIFLVVFLLTFTISIVGVNAQVKLTEKSKLFLNKIEKITIGMTVKQAEKAAAITLVNGDEPNKFCYYVSPKVKPKDISFMVSEYKIARIDIDNKNISTVKGAKIGDTETKIKQLYKGYIKVEPHQYVEKGHYLIFVPKDKVDQNYRIVFETDGKKVTRFRSGKLPEVEYVEGCS